MESEYSTDDEAWRARDRDAEREMARKNVATMAKRMLENKDRGRMAYLMGLSSTRTLSDKVREGRFTAAELVHLSYLCGFELQLEDKFQTMMDMVLD